MPVIIDSRLLSSRPRTANRIILDIIYEIVLIENILFLFIISIVTISFLFVHLHFKVFKNDITNFFGLCQHLFIFLSKIIEKCKY